MKHAQARPVLIAIVLGALLTSCGGGGGDDGSGGGNNPPSDNPLVWGSGTWGDGEYSD